MKLMSQKIDNKIKNKIISQIYKKRLLRNIIKFNRKIRKGKPSLVQEVQWFKLIIVPRSERWIVYMGTNSNLNNK